MINAGDMSRRESSNRTVDAGGGSGGVVAHQKRRLRISTRTKKYGKKKSLKENFKKK